jgi:alpha-beta hydrolase superfamily lysophospholipase
MKHGDVLKGAIVAGTLQNPNFLMQAGILLTGIYKTIFSGSYFSRLIHSLSIGPFNKPFRPNRTPYDWVSSDKRVVDEYIEDKFAGHDFTVGSWNQFYKMVIEVNRLENGQLDNDIPVLIISGDRDPVGKMGKDPAKLYEKYRNKGMTDVSLKLYPGGRHEILNEVNKAEVYGDVYQWIKSKI